MKNLTDLILSTNENIEFKNLFSFNRGIERETLRVTEDGRLSERPPPKELGNILTHPFITADFAEAQPELITSVHNSPAQVLSELEKIHAFVARTLKNELMWCASMPCELPPKSRIKIANFGETNLGRLKGLYRAGLAERYGKEMQTICAIHYNFSFSEDFWRWLKRTEKSEDSSRQFRSRRYFDLMRNFRRHSWLVTYLFGASPATCASFVQNRNHKLLEFHGQETVFSPHSTSLRSADIGYQSNVQDRYVRVSYNGLTEYVSSLKAAILNNFKAYEKFSNEKSQISSNLLQSEAEFYTTIRAKRKIDSEENFVYSLSSNGVEYVELRLLDLNPFTPLGINEDQIRFLDIFLLFCLLTESPKDDEKKLEDNAFNYNATIFNGREKGIILRNGAKETPLKTWANEILAQLLELANFLDRIEKSKENEKSLRNISKLIENPELTPSGKMLNEMDEKKLSFLDFGIQRSRKHKKYYLDLDLSLAELKFFKIISNESHQAAKKLDRDGKEDFNAYLKNFLDSYQR